MATVRIGDRELDVWARREPGGLGRTKAVILAEKAAREAKPEELCDHLADIVLAYVGDNPGVDRDWLLKHLPAEPYDIIGACAAASGLEMKAAAPGEAKSP